MPDLSMRIDRPELMDTEPLDDRLLGQTLSFLGMTARWFGGAEIVLKKLEAWSRRWDADRPVTILDVGAGGAEIPLSIARWARAAGRRVRVTALDLTPAVAAIARKNASADPDVEVRCCDINALAGRDERFDYVIATLFLHHVPPASIVPTLRLFDGLASRGVIVSDLARTYPSFCAVTALSWLAGNRVVRHDGPLSVRRSFTREELRSFAGDAGLSYLHASREPWLRLSLAGEKPC